MSAAGSAYRRYTKPKAGTGMSDILGSEGLRNPLVLP
jgi:hypothetical protein